MKRTCTPSAAEEGEVPALPTTTTGATTAGAEAVDADEIQVANPRSKAIKDGTVKAEGTKTIEGKANAEGMKKLEGKAKVEGTKEIEGKAKAGGTTHIGSEAKIDGATKTNAPSKSEGTMKANGKPKKLQSKKKKKEKKKSITGYFPGKKQKKPWYERLWCFLKVGYLPVVLTWPFADASQGR